MHARGEFLWLMCGWPFSALRALRALLFWPLRKVVDLSSAGEQNLSLLKVGELYIYVEGISVDEWLCERPPQIRLSKNSVS